MFIGNFTWGHLSMFEFKEDIEWVEIHERRLHEALGQTAVVGIGELDRNLSRGTRSGMKYDWLPYVSSDTNEFPQEQSGNLRSSIHFEELGKFEFAMGFFYDVSDKLHYQLGGDGETLVPISLNDFNDMIRWFEFDRNTSNAKPLFGSFEGAGSERIHEIMEKTIANQMWSR